MNSARTIFMTEHFDGANRVGSWSGATISSISDHNGVGATATMPERVNYLMADGHVESLAPADTYTSTNRQVSAPPSGFWTVWQYD